MSESASEDRNKTPTKRPVVLLHAYHDTGKDTFADFLQGRSSLWDDFCALYKSEDTKHLLKYQILNRVGDQWERLSFADGVRRQTEIQHASFLSYMRDKHGNDYQKLKGIEYDGPDAQYTGKTLRDLLLDIGMGGRAQDPGCWANDVARRAAETRLPVVVTDFRFPDEIERFCGIENVISIRLFRSAVPIPPADMRAEHDLDQYEPDFVLLPLRDAWKEMTVLLSRFPWASKYKIWMWSNH